MKLPRDPASLQAMRYIQMFDEALKKRGVQVLIGLELEMYGISSEKSEGAQKRQAEMIEKEFKHSILSSKWVAQKVAKDPAHNPKPGPVARFYHESLNLSGTNTTKFEITTTPSTPLRAAHRITGLKHFLYKRSRQENESRIRKITFYPYRSKAEDHTFGMHINKSLNEPGMEANMSGVVNPHSDVYEQIKDHSSTINYNDMALLISSAKSIRRINARKNEPHTYNRWNERRNEHEKAYVESTMPSADANPYFVVLHTMAGLYGMLRDLRPPQGKTSVRVKIEQAVLHLMYEPIINYPAQDMEGIIKRFEQEGEVLHEMRQVAEEAGVGRPEAKADVEMFKNRVVKKLSEAVNSKTSKGRL